MLIARSGRDTRTFLHDLPDEERLAIGQRGRARVLAAHTAGHRAQELERFVGEARA